jgi:hypothetical protein
MKSQHPILHDHVWSSYATAHSTAHPSFQSSAQFQTSTPTLLSIQLATFRVHHSTNYSLASNSDRVHLYTISDSNEKVTNSMTTTCCATCRSHHIAGTSGTCHAEHRPSRTEPDTDHATRSQYFPSRHSIASSTRPEQLYKIHETVPRNDQCLSPPPPSPFRCPRRPQQYASPVSTRSRKHTQGLRIARTSTCRYAGT